MGFWQNFGDTFLRGLFVGACIIFAEWRIRVCVRAVLDERQKESE